MKNRIIRLEQRRKRPTSNRPVFTEENERALLEVCIYLAQHGWDGLHIAPEIQPQTELVAEIEHIHPALLCDILVAANQCHLERTGRNIATQQQLNDGLLWSIEGKTL